MIFVGDIALPYKNAIKVEAPSEFYDKHWFGNLEGAIVDNPKNLKSKSIVFNDKEAVFSLINDFKFKGFALGNNHIFDAGSIDSTFRILDSYKIPYCGIGKSLTEASKPLVLNDKGQKITILNFGWEVIQCEITKGKHTGVNPLRKKHVIESVKKALLDNPNGKVIAFMHWSYELEAEPQPFERELAKKLIDLGISGVIGCHPHRVGGFEMYKNKPIVFSLGNWMFKQNYYNNRKSKFPDFCNLELAFEWDFLADNFQFHFFNYNRSNSVLTYLYTEGFDSSTMKKHTPFKGLSDKDFVRWYKKHHYHKNKGLPIYYIQDSLLVTKSKNMVNKLRDVIVQFRNYLT